MDSQFTYQYISSISSPQSWKLSLLELFISISKNICKFRLQMDKGYNKTGGNSLLRHFVSSSWKWKILIFLKFYTPVLSILRMFKRLRNTKKMLKCCHPNFIFVLIFRHFISWSWNVKRWHLIHYKWIQIYLSNGVDRQDTGHTYYKHFDTILLVHVLND